MCLTGKLVGEYDSLSALNAFPFTFSLVCGSVSLYVLLVLTSTRLYQLESDSIS